MVLVQSEYEYCCVMYLLPFIQSSALLNPAAPSSYDWTTTCAQLLAERGVPLVFISKVWNVLPLAEF